MEENERLAVLVDNAEHDVRHVTELLDKSDKERKRISDRNAQLTVNGMQGFTSVKGCNYVTVLGFKTNSFMVVSAPQEKLNLGSQNVLSCFTKGDLVFHVTE